MAALAAGAIAVGLAVASPGVSAESTGAHGRAPLRVDHRAGTTVAGALSVPGLRVPGAADPAGTRVPGLQPNGGPGHTPALTRTTGDRQSDTVQSTNWSGLAGTGSGIHGARATWTVPKIQASSSARYSSTWVGVDGATADDTDLIQLGTSQDTKDGYWAWTEILPATAEPLPATKVVEPGDVITASVQRTASDKWTMSMKDTTRGWTYTRNVTYGAPGESAEWIEEAPTLINRAGQQVQSTLADFGKVQIGSEQIYGNFGSGLGWYTPGMTAGNEIEMVNPAGTKVLAAPDAPATTSSGQRFTDTFVTAPSVPTHLTAVAEVESAHLTWDKPASTGGTAISSYEIRVYRNGALRRTVTARSTSSTVTGLVAGGRYRFEVAAHTAGNYTGAYTPMSSLVRPRA